MNLFVIGLTLDTVGKVLLGATVLMVHRFVMREHKIDGRVLRTMRREQLLGITGIVFIVVGYIMQVFFSYV